MSYFVRREEIIPIFVFKHATECNPQALYARRCFPGSPDCFVSSSNQLLWSRLSNLLPPAWHFSACPVLPSWTSFRLCFDCLAWILVPWFFNFEPRLPSSPGAAPRYSVLSEYLNEPRGFSRRRRH